jgi:hypothetical protein
MGYETDKLIKQARRARRSGLIPVAVILGGFGLLVLYQVLFSKPYYGESCESDRDCLIPKAVCLLPEGGTRGGGGTCTSWCEKDTDCPADWHCGSFVSNGFGPVMQGDLNHRAQVCSRATPR